MDLGPRAGQSPRLCSDPDLQDHENYRSDTPFVNVKDSIHVDAQYESGL